MKKTSIILIGLISAFLALILIPLFFYYASYLAYFFFDLIEIYQSILSRYFDEISVIALVCLTIVFVVSIFLTTIIALFDKSLDKK